MWIRVWVVLGLCWAWVVALPWLRARWAALLAGWPASFACASGDADGEGAVGDVLGRR